MGRKDGGITPGVIAVQKDASTDAAWVWIGAYVETTTLETVSAEIWTSATGARVTAVPLKWWSFDSELNRRGRATGCRFFHGHVRISLVAGGDQPLADFVVYVHAHHRRYEAQLPRVRALPSGLGTNRATRILVGSCYDADTDRSSRLAGAARPLVADDSTLPEVKLFVGDQVYLDAPFWRSALGLRRTPRLAYLRKYWRTWGGGGADGLRPLFGGGPNYFLPDDHEFWNNWPHRTVLARHSFRNVRLAFANSRKRAKAREADRAVALDLDSAWRQNHEPVAPDEWDAWSSGAFELFSSFQTRDDRSAELSGGERSPASSHDGSPYCTLVQSFEIGPVTAVLLDTRTRRMRRHDTENAGFVDPEAVAAVVKHAEAAPILMLCLAQPLLSDAKYPTGVPAGAPLPSDRSWLKDRSMHDYWVQYERFLADLLVARGGRPTVLIGGDVHHCYVGLAAELNLIEIVASPMSFVAWGKLLSRLKKVGHLVRRSHDHPMTVGGTYGDYSTIMRGPAGLLSPPAGGPTCVSRLGTRREGFALLDLRLVEPQTATAHGHVDLSVTLVDRDSAAAGGGVADHTVRFRLDLCCAATLSGSPSVHLVTSST